MNRADYINCAIRYLTWLSMQVEQSNNLDLTDLNKLSEDFYCDLLNLIYGYRLLNINVEDRNAAAIDLGDKEKRIAIQVTSTKGLAKVTKTVEKFVENNLQDDYDRLVILNIVKKSKHKQAEVVRDGFSLSTADDIWDIADLLRDIRNLDTAALKAVAEFLEGEFATAPGASIAKEVATILELVELISDENRSDVGARFAEDPDPDRKIRRRFTEKSKYLEDRYNDLYLDYGTALQEVLDTSDFGAVRVRRAANYMKEHSDRVLTECDGDPELALRRIVDELAGALSARGCDYDRTAIEFYVIWQLTCCNVFPNELVSQ